MPPLNLHYTERALPPTALLHTLVQRSKDGDGVNAQRIFLVRRSNNDEEEADNAGGRTLLRIYSYALDMDVSYRTVAISPTMTAAEIVPIALKSFGSMDPPSSYRLSVVITGKGTAERTSPVMAFVSAGP